MSEPDAAELEGTLKRIKSQAAAGTIRFTQHVQQEMVEEEISLDEVLEAIRVARVLEYYSEHRRGACCLLHGLAERGTLFISCVLRLDRYWL